jgi:hypothetical protein
MFHVKHFDTIDGLCKRIFARRGAARYEKEIWRKRRTAVGFIWGNLFNLLAMVRVPVLINSFIW